MLLKNAGATFNMSHSRHIYPLCVALIFKTLDLASELGLPFDEEVIMLLAKYGARARKFNNKLSDQQRTDILERARAFNDELVDQVVSAAEEYRGATKRVEVISLDDDEDTPMKNSHIHL